MDAFSPRRKNSRGEVVEGMESLKRKARTCVTCVFYEVNLGIVVDQEDGFFRKSFKQKALERGN